MSKSISILDKEYISWVRELCHRYRRSQIKAAVKVNQEVIRFYWELGRDIAMKQYSNIYGSRFYASLSRDMRRELGGSDGFSPTTVKYSYYFYRLYSQCVEGHPQTAEISAEQNRQQPVDDLGEENRQQPVDELQKQNSHQLAEQIMEDLFAIPWGHQVQIINKCKGDVSKALFFVRQTVDNGWSRSMLLNFLDTDLYERQGKAMTNFTRTLPEVTSDLAQELTKDPYCFAFTGITGKYNENVLKEALMHNITKFLVELGAGFAYVGKEYRLQIGEKERFIDLLFYNLNLSCYVVVEVKIGEFDFPDMGQLSGYVVACNHILRKDGRDNPTIGLLICRNRDKLLAQYALEGSNLPIGISEYELAKLYPEKIEGTIPTIEEIESKLSEKEDLEK